MSMYLHRGQQIDQDPLQCNEHSRLAPSGCRDMLIEGHLEWSDFGCRSSRRQCIEAG